jgi:16S rRNA (cytosine1402-N4)-methyltransferase
MYSTSLIRNSYSTHVPVLLQEVIGLLSPSPNKVYVDATFGAGSYSRSILEGEQAEVWSNIQA